MKELRASACPECGHRYAAVRPPTVACQRCEDMWLECEKARRIRADQHYPFKGIASR